MGSIVEQRNKQIEGLRGIALLLVVTYHLICRFGQLYLNKDYYILHYFGSAGTSFFLLITAYYLGNAAFSGENFGVGDFLKKRIGKLWPTYAVSVVTIFLFLIPFPLPGRKVGIGDLFLNLIMVNGYLERPYVDGSHWYLTTIVSYIGIIGLFRKGNISDNWIPYMIWMITGVIFKFLNVPILGKILGNNFIGYAVVGLILYASIELKRRVGLGWIITGIVALFYIALVSGRAYFVELLVAVPIFVAVQYRKIGLLENWLLVKLGTVSYSIYLIHQNIGLSVEYQLMVLSGSYSIWYAVPALITAVIIGSFVYFVVEKNTKKRKNV